MNIRNKIFWVFVLMIISIRTFSQEKANGEWVLYKYSDSLDIYYHQIDCVIPKEGVYRSYDFFKFVNKSDQYLIISWDYKVWYGNVCSGCNSGSEFHREVRLKANSVIESSCEKQIPELTIFRRFLNYDTPDVLTNFEFYNIKIRIYEE